MSAPRWQPVATLLLCVFGLGVSVYLTITHFDKVALVCSDSGTINCAKVTTSPQSVIFGIPVAMLGLAYFVPMLALCLPAAWRAADRRVHLARLALAVVGRRDDPVPARRRALHHQGDLPVVLVGARRHVPPLRDHHHHHTRSARPRPRPCPMRRTAPTARARPLRATDGTGDRSRCGRAGSGGDGPGAGAPGRRAPRRHAEEPHRGRRVERRRGHPGRGDRARRLLPSPGRPRRPGR